MKKLVLITLCTITIVGIFTAFTIKEKNDYLIITKNESAIANEFEGTISKDLEIEFTDFKFEKIDLILVSGNKLKNYLFQPNALKFHYQLTLKRDEFECNGSTCSYKIKGVKKKYSADYIVLVADGKEENTYVEFKRN